MAAIIQNDPKDLPGIVNKANAAFPTLLAQIKGDGARDLLYKADKRPTLATVVKSLFGS